NPSNFYASQGVLGRSVRLLSLVPFDVYGNRLTAINTPSSAWGNGSVSHPILLAFGATGERPQNGENERIETSTTDLVETSIDQTRTQLAAFIAYLESNPDLPQDWWAPLIYRSQADPRPPRPLDTEAAARTTPVFLENCSSFIVEYAGDYVTQYADVRTKVTGSQAPLYPNGKEGPDGRITREDMLDSRFGLVTAFEPDGKIDFIAEFRPDPFVGTQGIEHIRWYG